MNQIVSLDQILPHNKTLEHRLDKDNIHKRPKQDIACLYGYSSKPKECNVIGDIEEFFLNPIGAVVKLAKRPKYANSTTKPDIVDAALQAEISWYEREIATIYNRLYTILKDLPQFYLDSLFTIRPPPTTTNFLPHNKNTHWKNSNLRIILENIKNFLLKLKKKMTNMQEEKIYQTITFNQDQNVSSNCFQQFQQHSGNIFGSLQCL
jgi:hypothetical protein